MTAPPPPTMQAVVCRQAGGPDVLEVHERPVPEPGHGQVLVRVHARGVNRSEVFTRQGDSGDAVAFPRVLGIELVGEVAATPVGSALTVGQTVAAAMGGLGRAYDGGYQQYALIPEDRAMAVRTTLDWTTFAALPETWLTAAGALGLLSLESGQALLVTAATSSVGMACVRLAAARGLTVVATTRTARKTAALTAAGAAHVITLGPEHLPGAVDAVVPGGVHGAVDLAGRDWLRASLHAVRRGGTVCATGILDGWVLDDFMPLSEIPTGTRLTAYSSETLDGATAAADLQAIVDDVEAGRLTPDLDRTYPLAQAAEAHRRLESGASVGKVVLVG